MEQKLRSLLKVLTNNLVTVYSWGIKNVEVSSKDITFSVNGLKYNGNVVLTYEDNDYKATFDNNTVIISDSVCTLINLIDNAIETTGQYKNDVLEWFVGNI